ncbi:interleukin-17D isoform X2 [Eubalaena glacialis]|uniref:interleukin-17D isoform X2 n=1 Tax=Eubalaena glacialis TaxID=27606 RepID=UPI002A5AB16E|nr:interleukin-17D isoform X2 [Eubalaena glacialis]
MFGAWISEVLGGQRGTASWCLGEGEAPPPPVRNALHLQSLRGSRGEEAASRPRARLSGCPSRSRGAFVREALRRGRTRPTSLPAEAPPSAQRRAAPLGTCPRLRDHRSHFGAMLGPPVWALVAGVLLALSPGRAGGAPRAGRRPARTRGCADRPEELLEQLYGRLAAGVLGAFHHTLQLGPREQARNASCPAGGRPADRRFRPPTNLRSVSPWAYRISYDPGRFPRYLPEAYCLCRGCLTGPRGEEDVRLRSAPVLVPAVVLRRTPACAGGRAVYTEEYITIPVGCTCMPGPDKDADGANSSLAKPARP